MMETFTIAMQELPERQDTDFVREQLADFPMGHKVFLEKGLVQQEGVT